MKNCEEYQMQKELEIKKNNAYINLKEQKDF
jgi:hypothetical protein